MTKSKNINLPDLHYAFEKLISGIGSEEWQDTMFARQMLNSISESFKAYVKSLGGEKLIYPSEYDIKTWSNSLDRLHQYFAGSKTNKHDAFVHALYLRREYKSIIEMKRAA